MFKKIIVGYDFCDVSQRAALVAAQLATQLKATAVLVHVVHQAPEVVAGVPHPPDERAALEHRLAEHAKNLGNSTGASVDWGVVEGRPAEALVTFADRWGGDLVVVGTAGRKGIPRVLLGSVAERLSRICPIPVMMVGPERE